MADNEKQSKTKHAAGWQSTVLVCLIVVSAVGATLSCLAMIMGHENHQQKCTELKGLGFAAAAKGHLTDAERLYETSVKEAEQSVNILQLPASLCELADLYTRDGKYDAAADCVRRALSLYAKLKLNSVHETATNETSTINRNTAKAEAQLARILNRAGKIKLAESADMYQRALAQDNDTCFDLDTRNALTKEYSTLLESLGRSADSAKLQIATESDNGSVSDGINHLSLGSKLLFERGETGSSQRELQTALSVALHHGDTKLERQSAVILAADLIANADLVQAEKVLRHAVSAANLSNSTNANVAQAFSMLAYCLSVQGKQSDTEPNKQFDSQQNLEHDTQPNKQPDSQQNPERDTQANTQPAATALQRALNESEAFLKKAYALDTITMSCRTGWQVWVRLAWDKQGKYDEKQRFDQWLLERAKQHFESGSIEIAYCLIALAEDNKEMNRMDEAEKYAKESLPIFEQSKVRDRIAYASALKLLGQRYRESGNNELAQSYETKMQQILSGPR